MPARGAAGLGSLALFPIPFHLRCLPRVEAAIRLFAGWAHGMSATAEQFGAICPLLLAQST